MKVVSHIGGLLISTMTIGTSLMGYAPSEDIEILRHQLQW